MWLPSELVAEVGEEKKVCTVKRAFKFFAYEIDTMIKNSGTIENVLNYFIRNSSLNDKGNILIEIEPDKNKRHAIKKVALEVVGYEETETNGQKLFVCDVEVTTICEVNNDPISN